MSTTLETPCSAAPPGENDLDLILNQIWLGDSDRLCQARQIRERVQASWRLEAESAGVETRLGAIAIANGRAARDPAVLAVFTKGDTHAAAGPTLHM